MAIILPCTGTTKEWQDNNVILKNNEIGFELLADGHCNVRQGNGTSPFLSCPIRVSTKTYADALAAVEGDMNTINAFSKNMAEAANNANTKATAANNAAAAANAAAKACEGIVDGMNTMADATLGKSFKMIVDNGIIYLEEV